MLMPWEHAVITLIKTARLFTFTWRIITPGFVLLLYITAWHWCEKYLHQRCRSAHVILAMVLPVETGSRSLNLHHTTRRLLGLCKNEIFTSKIACCLFTSIIDYVLLGWNFEFAIKAPTSIVRYAPWRNKSVPYIHVALPLTSMYTSRRVIIFWQRCRNCALATLN